MRQAFSPLLGPLKSKYLWPQRQWLQPPPADIAATNVAPLFSYAFRVGGFWQPQKTILWPAPPGDGQATPDQFPWPSFPFRLFWQPHLPWLFPPPADIAPTNSPPLFPYAFRRGGFWPPQQRWGTQRPADVAFPNAPPLPQYRFRPGGLWQWFRALGGALSANPPIFTAYVPPPTGAEGDSPVGSNTYSATGSEGGDLTGSISPSPTGVESDFSGSG